MKSIDGILTLVDNEFSAIVQNGKFRSREEIDSVYKLMDIVKDAHCIWAYEDEEESNYSEGMSMGRGRGAKRDRMGRYSRDGGYGYRGRSYRGYSRDGGRYDYIDELHAMMETAPDEQTRQSIQRMIQQMEQG